VKRRTDAAWRSKAFLVGAAVAATAVSGFGCWQSSAADHGSDAADDDFVLPDGVGPRDDGDAPLDRADAADDGMAVPDRADAADDGSIMSDSRDGADDAAVSSPECSACRAKSESECLLDLGCEGIPYWGESRIPCTLDERGFSTNCPSEGCRQAGMVAICPTLEGLVADCSPYCSYNSFSLDERGCRVCPCGYDNPVATCARDALCAADPAAEACRPAGTCPESRLVLGPVRLEALMPPEPPSTGSCSGTGTDSVYVRIYSAGVLVREATLPCLVDLVDVGPLVPGDYEIAAVDRPGDAVAYLRGLRLLGDLFPGSEYACPAGTLDHSCEPLRVTVGACGLTSVALELRCFEYGCADCCGGA
jgi:hypothetical protein